LAGHTCFSRHKTNSILKAEQHLYPT